mmetsp:Transcript_10047/g.13043  ORF Transcript_10047/g.13043 Transcript_10047/m.13043 type:complete len:578 (-) Transcript_10047:143-1876(-)|eukprot:CAMPEP_0204874200 /NCGR_PEP_ID=MMETSP1348-20121228/42642_1 /ASSEMBLY_ACC=CAM_ASM_000700 /TAXON_ID=215587 /ORGANISM="Aplanochytrium stocchinoi, Strain GSBS06" /LENGTH=577 /DNA_ID=CAMNT_0052029911 /DNA_START=69 /DNA_END=1802 /DNA_ORIENTATION=-
MSNQKTSATGSSEVNACDERFHNTALHDAASRGDIEDLKSLLQRNGVDVNKKNKYGNTPLAEAARHGKQKVMELLLDNGAEMDLRNKAGCTPYDIAHLSGHKIEEKIFTRYKKNKKDQRRKLNLQSESGGQLCETLGAVEKKEEVKLYPRKLKIKTVNVLALNGGGIRGYYTIWILKNLIDRIRNNTSGGKYSERAFLKRFSVIAGTSTGSITAAFIVVELRKENYDRESDMAGTPILNSAIKIYDTYKQDIFYSPSWSPKFARMMLNGPMYSTSKFEQRLKEILVEETVDETGETKRVPAEFRNHRPFTEENMPFLHISSFNLTTTHIAEFTDRHDSLGYYNEDTKTLESSCFSTFDSHSNAKIWEAVLASSAAPIYFPSRKIKVETHHDSHGFKQEGGMHEFCDGGVYANNPGLAALGFARMLSEFEDDETTYTRYSVLNIGTMFTKSKIDLDKTWFGGGGLYTWMNPFKDIPLLNVVSQANTNFIRNTLKRLNITAMMREENEDDLAYFEIDNYNIKGIKLDGYDDDTMKELKAGAMKRFEEDSGDNSWFLDKLDEWIGRNLLSKEECSNISKL